MAKKCAASIGLHSTLVDVLLWGLAQHADPSIEAIRERWGVDRATSYRWKRTLDDARARWSTMQRSRRPLEVCGRSAVTEPEGDDRPDCRVPGVTGVRVR